MKNVSGRSGGFSTLRRVLIRCIRLCSSLDPSHWFISQLLMCAQRWIISSPPLPTLCLFKQLCCIGSREGKTREKRDARKKRKKGKRKGKRRALTSLTPESQSLSLNHSRKPKIQKSLSLCPKPKPVQKNQSFKLNKKKPLLPHIKNHKAFALVQSPQKSSHLFSITVRPRSCNLYFYTRQR